jgi:phosphopantothenoylcysteine decarboxylase/phosphopantothenate--cysteine ligase
MTKPLVVLGVTGGIAAYKSADLIRKLKDQNFSVQVVTTKSALNFIGQATLAALSGKAVITDLWENVHEVEHVAIGKKAAAIVVAPATADFLAHLVYGFANDALLATVLVAKCPIIVAPAMHTEMWENIATKENVKTLRSRGFYVLEPAVGKLTGEDVGAGRLPEPIEIAKLVKQIVNRNSVNLPRDLNGLNVLISAGGTREALDPIRFVGNRASGKQGVALALAAMARGAKVSLVGANLNISIPAGLEYIPVVSAKELQEQMILRTGSSDVVIMNAAVADYFQPNPSESKIKKSGEEMSITLSKTPDVLAEITQIKTEQQYIVGFAAETETSNDKLIELAKNKLKNKNCDLVVANTVSTSKGMESDVNQGVMVSKTTVKELPETDKLTLADAVWDFISQDLVKRGRLLNSPVEPDLV